MSEKPEKYIQEIKDLEIKLLNTVDEQEIPTIIPAMMGAILTILEHPSIDDHTLRLATVNLGMIISRISMPLNMKNNTGEAPPFSTDYH